MMKVLNVLNEYQVYINNGCLAQMFKQPFGHSLVIIDKNVELNIDGAVKMIFDEAHKNLNTVNELYDIFLKHNVRRDFTTIFAIGGGVCLDTVGYAASTFKRGVDVVYVPTTLLSMVDACIGGKIGVNYHELKNFIGNFYHPQAVVIDPSILHSLDQRQFNNGMAEVIKYGCIYDRKLLQEIQTPNLDLENLIYRCLKIKLHFIKKDVYDHHYRHALNFGHTYGHAIESYYHFDKYLHGEAISIGMNMMIDDPLLKQACRYYHLPVALDEEIDLEALVKQDKKNTDSVKFVRLKKLGKVDEKSL